MIKKTLTLLKASLRRFGKKSALDPSSSGSGPFHSLSPIDNADIDGSYSKALSWALEHRKKGDIKNIALTGPYGSGNSSILKTFQANNTNPDLEFLNISLATFKEEKPNEGSAAGDDLLRLIELSILQQIFYHEEDEKIPDSRFKKIKSVKKHRLWLLAGGLILFIASLLYVIDPKIIASLLRVTIGEGLDEILHYISLAVVCSGIVWTVFSSIRSLRSLKLSKFNFQDAEFEIGEHISKSILNDHLDEILYFFEVTPYTVVIIEDLDRFQQTEIFTKLRELNLLINYSNKVKREIVFIYAVRDDMFKDKDRTKFFDFIIPVIPVINSSNSNEKFLAIVAENGYSIHHTLIEDISLFIDDMRLLYNITNEYHIYQEKLSGKLDQNKLLAMVVYKNIYPNDFVELSNASGKLHGVFEQKNSYIKEQELKIDSEILPIKQRIKQAQTAKLRDTAELRRLYVLGYITDLNYITGFYINGVNCTFEQVAADEDLFDYLINDDAQYVAFRHYSGSYHIPETKPIALKFATVEKEVDPQMDYQARYDQIHDASTASIEGFKRRIEDLEGMKTKIRHLKLKEIMARGSMALDLEDKKQRQLISILIRSGYIDEHYLDYVSIFYEGSITKQDREFLLNVKGQIEMDFDYKLNKIDKLVAKIAPVDFEQDYILNYNLLDFLLKKWNYIAQKAAIFDQLKDESDRSVAFIDGFIESGEHIGEFMQELAKVWPNLWNYLTLQTDFTAEKVAGYFKLIIAHVDIAEITKIAAHSKFSDYIENLPDFLKVIPDVEKLKKILTALSIHLKQVDFTDAPEPLVRFVYEGNYYAISDAMLRAVIKANGEFDEKVYLTKNYYAIDTCGCGDLVSYVVDHMEEYVADVYLAIDENIHEDQEYLVHLLNDENLSLELKERVIDRVETKVKMIGDIDDIEIDKLLLLRSKVEADWKNLIDFYHNLDQAFDEHIIAFLNDPANADELSRVEIDTENPKPDLATVKKFMVAMLLEKAIEDINYAKVIRSIPYQYTDLAFENLSFIKIRMLIDDWKISMNKIQYDRLKANYENLHISLAQQRPDDFINLINELVIDERDAHQLLESDYFTTLQKNEIISVIGDDMIIGSLRIENVICRKTLVDQGLVYSKEVLLHILTHASETSERIRLFNVKSHLLDRDDLHTFLSSLPEPYSEIAVPGKRPALPVTHENWMLAIILKEAGYIKNADEDKKGIRISTFRK